MKTRGGRVVVRDANNPVCRVYTGADDAAAWLQCLALVLMFLTAFFCEVTATGPKK